MKESGRSLGARAAFAYVRSSSDEVRRDVARTSSMTKAGTGPDAGVWMTP